MGLEQNKNNNDKELDGLVDINENYAGIYENGNLTGYLKKLDKTPFNKETMAYLFTPETLDKYGYEVDFVADTIGLAIAEWKIYHATDVSYYGKFSNAKPWAEAFKNESWEYFGALDDINYVISRGIVTHLLENVDKYKENKKEFRETINRLWFSSHLTFKDVLLLNKVGLVADKDLKTLISITLRSLEYQVININAFAEKLQPEKFLIKAEDIKYLFENNYINEIRARKLFDLMNKRKDMVNTAEKISKEVTSEILRNSKG